MLYRIIDDYLPVDVYEAIQNHCRSTSYTINEADITGVTPEIKAVSELDIHKLPDFPEQLGGQELNRAYINYYTPNETSHFHKDSNKPDSLTLLYYPNPTYDINEGGATELVINDEIVGVRSKANRALIFKSELWHRATPFHTKQRFTVDLKYGT